MSLQSRPHCHCGLLRTATHTEHLGVITCPDPWGHHLSGASVWEEGCLIFVQQSTFNVKLCIQCYTNTHIKTSPFSQRQSNTSSWSCLSGSEAVVQQEGSSDDCSLSKPSNTPPSTASSATDMSQTLYLALVGLKSQMGKIMHRREPRHPNKHIHI